MVIWWRSSTVVDMSFILKWHYYAVPWVMEQIVTLLDSIEKQELKKLKTMQHMPIDNEVQLCAGEDDVILRAEDEEAITDMSVAPRRLRRAETVLQNRAGRIILVLPQVTESFSQQAMIRTAESLGVQYIYALRPKDRYRMSHAVMKGSKSWVTIVLFDSEQELIDECKKGELWVLANNHLPISLPDGSRRVPLPLTPTLFASHEHRFPAFECDVDAVQQWQQQVIAQTDTQSTTENPLSQLQPPTFPKTTPGSSVFGFPSPLHLVVSEDVCRTAVSLLIAADKLVFMPRYGFALDGCTPSVALAIVLDRCFLLCPEARGSLTPEQKQKVRAVWYEHLASTPQHRVLYQQWLLRADTIEPLEELRISKDKVPMRNARLKKKLVMLNEANRTSLAPKEQ